VNPDAVIGAGALWLAIPLALAAGLVSFLSPCILPLVPGYLGFISGEVAVVNVWYAGCGPCRIEAKDLEAVWQKHKDDGVAFVGVNIYDQADTARAFAEKYGITYPSLMDADTGQAKLAFAKVTPIQAPPTTLVLDKQGRVAARIIGPIDGTSILSTLIQDALKEKV
jgi:thiol-disulfide isomerase/thioredoxin